MTDHLPPPSDEDLSAALDGEADAEAQARIDAHPVSSRRSAELEAASAFLRASSVPSLDDEAAERLVGEALRAPLAPPRPARSGQPARWLVAAVIVVLVAVGLTLVWTGRDSGTDQAFDTVGNEISAGTDAPASADESGSAELFDAGEAPHSEEALADTGSPGPLIDLGSFDSGDDLREALADTMTARVATTDSANLSGTDTRSVSRCATQLAVALDLPDPALTTAVAVVDGTPVLVYEFAIESFDDGQPTTLVAAVDTEACAQVIVFER